MTAPYPKRHVGGFIDLPSTSTPADSQFLNAVEAALLQLLGELPAQDEVGVWNAGGANGALVYQKITNAQIAAGAAIDRSKLGALNIVNADVAGGAAIDKAKLGPLNIGNADVDSAAAIAKSKLAALNIVNSDVAAGAAIAQTKLAGIPVGTSLPGSPADGDRAVLVDSTTAPSYSWLFQYVAGISDSYKWIFLGGSPATSHIGQVESTTSTTFTDLATSQPLAVPRNGIYKVEAKVQVICNSAGVCAAMGWEQAGNFGASVDRAATIQIPTTNGYDGRDTAYGAFTDALNTNNLVAKFRSHPSGGFTTEFMQRSLYLTPRRVA